ncbi:helix-turn-helix domain-containing protein [Kitasatospora cineracea]|uniref:Pyridoxamine 5'-phosphate oxidase-like protein n=1 Tax=Kitasatospora cineracea TaxID=88074 RepID=A0A3N4RZ24_9ACTN|nr:pyridoxamine 5'-phosphate oxidase family protein [Kitasatospora cineracea]ROR45571.1 pyridoxamine 5'-phosphate oxidase-like protein [Kitasatospora cineracea]RPE35925.1 pyridoxamine 5'-phosphate oxidase-like protein [Kitasatospora cineracea]
MQPQTDPETAGAIARRIADRRAVLGLGTDALAREAGMSRPYLEFLTAAGPGFDPNGFLRIAAALGLTYRELVEGLPDRPPGQGPPAPRPVLVRLTEEECWERVDARGVGRIALPGDPEPAVFPVNYTVDRGGVVYRTHERGAAAAAPGTAVSFEVDRIDDHRRTGWSVLITGTAERIEDHETLQRLLRDLAVQPWAGGPRTLWIRIRPTSVSGRRIVGAPPPEED